VIAEKTAKNFRGLFYFAAPCIYAQKMEKLHWIFSTKCTVNSGKLCENCMLWQKLHRFTNLSKLRKNCSVQLCSFLVVLYNGVWLAIYKAEATEESYSSDKDVVTMLPVAFFWLLIQENCAKIVFWQKFHSFTNLSLHSNHLSQ